MRITTATEPGDPTKPNEDWLLAEPNLMIMLDGATARTETGCRHGIAWFTAKLGSAITGYAAEPHLDLPTVLSASIITTAEQHRECDLTHPGTPSAAVAIVRRRGETFEYLVLGDITLVLDTKDELRVIADDRVDATAVAERAEAARHPFGTAEKQAALLKMKRLELALRNKPDGFWTASTDPEAAQHALTGAVPAVELRRLMLLTDGAARAVAMFRLMDWPALLALLDRDGPTQVLRVVREAEHADASGGRWHRNKLSDDASVIFASF